MSKPHTGGALLGVVVLAAMAGVLWLVDREVTQGLVTEYLSFFRPR